MLDTLSNDFIISQKNSLNYQYLCSLVANFPVTKLSDTNHKSINNFIITNKHKSVATFSINPTMLF